MMCIVLLVSLVVEASAAVTTISRYGGLTCQGVSTELGQFSDCQANVFTAYCIKWTGNDPTDATKSVLFATSDAGGIYLTYEDNDCKGSVKKDGYNYFAAAGVAAAQTGGCITGKNVQTHDDGSFKGESRWHIKCSGVAPTFGTMSSFAAAGCAGGGSVLGTAGEVFAVNYHCCEWTGAKADDPAKSFALGCLKDGSTSLSMTSNTGCTGRETSSGWFSKSHSEAAEQGQCFATGGSSFKRSQPYAFCGGAEISSTVTFGMPFATVLLAVSALVAISDM
mmetsp:Transcript_132044/g.240225  ORF Transcript_132044/g.240225 Transcript_132044/m.240225 type:complete len:279 (-) Transcript_132044:143-979(-)